MIVLGTGTLAACTSTKPLYDQEEFATTSPFSREYAASGGATCEAARRALLSQGYVIDKAKADVIDGRKSFQTEPDKHFEIEFHVVCASDGANGASTTAFVNALQERYALKKTPSSASVGVGAVGALSLPFGASDDSLVKVGSETIHQQAFYDRFFELIQFYLVPGRSVPVDTDEPKKPSAPPGPRSD